VSKHYQPQTRKKKSFLENPKTPSCTHTNLKIKNLLQTHIRKRISMKRHSSFQSKINKNTLGLRVIMNFRIKKRKERVGK
jgi:hypothetical protein